MYWSKNNCGEIHVFQGLDLAFTSDWPIILSHGRLIRTSCSGGSRGGTPLFLDQTEAQRAEKFFGGDRNPCPLSKGLDDQPPNLSQGLDSALICSWAKLLLSKSSRRLKVHGLYNLERSWILVVILISPWIRLRSMKSTWFLY